MSKRNLVAPYTAPAHLLKPEAEEEPQHVAAKSDYNSQRFKRLVNVAETKTYRQRLDEARRLREQPETQEPEPKRLRQDKNGAASENGATAKDGTDETKDETVRDAKDTSDIADKSVKDVAKDDEANGNGEASGVDVYVPPEETAPTVAADMLPDYDGIPMRKEDVTHFALLLRDQSSLDADEARAFRVLDLVFRVKNGQKNVRKKAMRSVTLAAAEIGPAPLFGVILPLMLEPALDEADRHILTKLLGRLLYRLDDTIAPYTQQIITAVAPLLIDEDMTLRLESRDVISGVARGAGFASIVASLRPDLDHADEYVRNLTARVFAVVATTLGLAKVLPFVKAVIRLKKSWQARHTGIRIVHHLCVLLGGGNGALVLPHLPQLVEVLSPGLLDELVQVRTATANTIALLADSVHPYGIDAFEQILEPAWAGVKHHRGRALAAFLRCIGLLIPLMAHDPQYVEYSNYYTRELMGVMVREFSSPDDDMRKSLLRLVASMPLTKSIFPNFRKQVFAPFLQNFWTRRVALDVVQVGRLVVDATALLAKKLDVAYMLEKLTPYAKDPNENLRRMAADAINKILSVSPEAIVELDAKFDAVLVDSVLYAFQEQTQPHPVYLNAVSTTCRVLGLRLEPHVSVILSTMLYRLKNSEPEIRQQAADLVAAIADVIYKCAHGDNTMIYRLILFLYELLGEVYPEVLGSIIGALHGCIKPLDRESLLALENPSIAMLLPTLTPVLKNRQEKVQEQCIKLVGLIAQRNAENINAKEWMRICFDLLNMLKSQRKRIRVAANATFGHIANTIGPQDVLAMLLNNLNVQERQLRVCTAVAIGIVADTCSPFTVLPALMNEYRVPDKNVQNGVLKALSFLFEYIDGSTTKDYLFAITPLLEDALTDRDQVHRQTAATVVRHLALNCTGQAHGGYQDVFVHFLNHVLPNIYEQSPHVIIRILECLDALRLVLGPGLFFNYIWPGLFQAARKVRTPYWKVYNSAYVQNCDSIVPYYPRLDSLPDGDSYNVEELDIWL